ncbi:hypothetical protein MRX96_044009 [Rhipicephalus microplus]
MARSVALMLLLLLLKSFLEESEGAGGWTEVKDPDTPEYRGLARFAYKNQRCYWSPCLTFLVTQGRWQPSPKFVCYYLKFHPPYGAWHFPYPDGTPCWEGYTTSCSYTCSDVTGAERVMNYEEDTPCIRSSEEVESIKLAGLCKKGVCVEPSEIGLTDAGVKDLRLDSETDLCTWIIV